MKTLATSLLIVCAALSFQSLAQAAIMNTGKVEMVFQTRDGFPVEGMALAGILSYEALSSQDCSGFICAPSFPKYKLTSDGAQMLGETNSQGQLVVSPRAWKASALTARKLSVAFFSNGVLMDLCKDGTDSYVNDSLNLLPQFIDQKPVPRNPECNTVTVKDGETAEVRITCISPYSQAEIENMKEQILKTCSR